MLVARELLNTAQDDGGNSVFIQTAPPRQCRAARPDIAPRNSDEGSGQTNLGGDDK
jgi:hypothetical protein